MPIRKMKNEQKISKKITHVSQCLLTKYCTGVLAEKWHKNPVSLQREGTKGEYTRRLSRILEDSRTQASWKDKHETCKLKPIQHKRVWRIIHKRGKRVNKVICEQ